MSRASWQEEGNLMLSFVAHVIHFNANTAAKSLRRRAFKIAAHDHTNPAWGDWLQTWSGETLVVGAHYSRDIIDEDEKYTAQIDFTEDQKATEKKKLMEYTRKVILLPWETVRVWTVAKVDRKWKTLNT